MLTDLAQARTLPIIGTAQVSGTPSLPPASETLRSDKLTDNTGVGLIHGVGVCVPYNLRVYTGSEFYTWATSEHLSIIYSLISVCVCVITYIYVRERVERFYLLTSLYDHNIPLNFFESTVCVSVCFCGFVFTYPYSREENFTLVRPHLSPSHFLYKYF